MTHINNRDKTSVSGPPVTDEMIALLRKVHKAGDMGRSDIDMLFDRIAQDRERTKAMEADNARIDWLESQSSTGQDWVARQSTTGRGFRLHQSPAHYRNDLSYQPTARAAIDAAIKRG